MDFVNLMKCATARIGAVPASPSAAGSGDLRNLVMKRLRIFWLWCAFIKQNWLSALFLSQVELYDSPPQFPVAFEMHSVKAGCYDRIVHLVEAVLGLSFNESCDIGNATALADRL